MTEKEKRDAGLLYNAGNDEELIAEVRKAKNLCHQYNQLAPMDFEGHRAILSKLFGKIGERINIYPPFWCDYGYNIEVGEDFFANHGVTILDGGKVKFGDHVLIGPGCGFHTAGHPLLADQRDRWLVFNKPITVGSNVWFGAGVQVLPGVSIGDNVVVAAGSVVTHDLPPGCVAAGNPCKVLREITEDDRIAEP